MAKTRTFSREMALELPNSNHMKLDRAEFNAKGLKQPIDIVFKFQPQIRHFQLLLYCHFGELWVHDVAFLRYSGAVRLSLTSLFC